MGAVNYRQIPSLLRARVPFHGSSMRAAVEDGDYVVYSYAVEIARVTEAGEVRLNEETYSATTSRQQNLCREHLA